MKWDLSIFECYIKHEPFYAILNFNICLMFLHLQTFADIVKVISMRTKLDPFDHIYLSMNSISNSVDKAEKNCNCDLMIAIIS